MLITPEQLKAISTAMNLQRCTTIAGLLNDICPKYGIDTTNEFEEFIAQLMHESGEFTITIENMNYTTPQRIVDVWPDRFNLTGTGGKLNANDYIRNAPKLANTVYAKRMGNGDFASGDGFHFRGGGPMQMTGRESYEKFLAWYNKTFNQTLTLDELVEKVQNRDDFGVHAACWEFAVNKQLLDEAIEDDFKKITRIVNGGLIGWNDRLFYYNRTLRVLRAA